MDSYNNIIALDVRCGSLQLLKRSESELLTANTKPCLLILRHGNIYLQAEIMTVLEEQRENLESKRKTKVVSQADQVKTTGDTSQTIVEILAHKLLS